MQNRHKQLEAIHACKALGCHNTAEAMASMMAKDLEWQARQEEADKSMYEDRKRMAHEPSPFDAMRIPASVFQGLEEPPV